MLVPDRPDLDSDGRGGADDVAQDDDHRLLHALDLGAGDALNGVSAGPVMINKAINDGN